MIESLSYSVTFPTNQVSLIGELSFQPGLTAVTGPNGIGKTFAASEMPRYMLFGKKALRGPASDYKNLSGSMSVTIAGKRFQIDRAKKETVKDESGTVVAVGAEAVNSYIIQQLGFDLDVFDAVCSSNQKESDRLTQLRPGQRKQMIDEIVGLSHNEAVEKQCKDEAKQLRRDAETIRDTIVPAVEPNKPADYQPSDDLFEQLRAAKAVADRRAQLDKVIALVWPEPQAPSLPEPGASQLAELEQHEQTRVALDAAIAQLEQRISAIPEATYTAEDLDFAEAMHEYEDELLRRGPQPTMTSEKVEADIAAWNVYYALSEQERLEVICPECSHTFLTGQQIPEPPETPLNVLFQERSALHFWTSPLIKPEGPLLKYLPTKEECKAARLALMKQAEKRQLEWELGSLEPLPNRSEELKACRRAVAEWESYRATHADWKKTSDIADEAKAELACLPPATDVDDLNNRYTNARIYEVQQEAYLAAKERQEELTALVASNLKRAEAYKRGAEALQRARAAFKAYLAPSLGKVASSLLTQMSAGRLTSVIVDEDMNISVDGQEVSTLSGAQATVANIALRLALGRVLFSKVFPIFLGDEIDAYSDAEMTASTAEALANLKSQLRQIILISHKPLDFADHHIKIGESPELLAA